MECAGAKHCLPAVQVSGHARALALAAAPGGTDRDADTTSQTADSSRNLDLPDHLPCYSGPWSCLYCGSSDSAERFTPRKIPGLCNRYCNELGTLLSLYPGLQPLALQSRPLCIV